MSRWPPRAGGGSPGLEPGIAPRERWAIPLMRSALTIPVIALALATWSLLSSVADPELTGVRAEEGVVVSVDPESLAWAYGIRSGQTVIELKPADDPAGWSLTSGHGQDRFVISLRSAVVNSRVGIPLALIAISMAIAGLAASATRRPRAELLSVVALTAAWIPFSIAHDLVGEPLMNLAAVSGLTYWLYRWATRWRRVAIGLALLGGSVALVWIGARLLANEDVLHAADLVRFWLTVAALVGVCIVASDSSIRATSRRARLIRPLDVGVITAGVIVIALADASLHVGLAVAMGLGILLVLVYGRGRTFVRATMDRAFFADARQRATIAAAEAERARLSRELHDDPLQAIAGVIQSLESQPLAARERETLRTVAAQLRGLATDLRPPILDDLGLVPAIESLFHDRGGVPVVVQIANESGYLRADRPPPEIELGAYRIVQEAASNAIRHAGCQHLLIRGHVRQEEVVVEVIDDGKGISEGAIERAMRAGHIGISSMRRRAEAMDAQLHHQSGLSGGTMVRLRWTS